MIVQQLNMVLNKRQHWVIKREEDVKDFLSFIRFYFNQNPPETDMDFIINRYSFKTGISPRKLKEYLDQLQLARLIEFEEKTIKYVG